MGQSSQPWAVKRASDFSAEEREVIRERRKYQSARELAQVFQCHSATIGSICGGGNRKRVAAWWKHVKVDECDEGLLRDYIIHLHRNPDGYVLLYARDRISGRDVVFARLIMTPRRDQIVDHINGDTLDNRRCNLRVCTAEQNSRNVKARAGTSRFKGVCLDVSGWHAQIRQGCKTTHLGFFKTEEEAARAYDAAARSRHGDFASLNFPVPGEASALRLSPSEYLEAAEFARADARNDNRPAIRDEFGDGDIAEAFHTHPSTDGAA